MRSPVSPPFVTVIVALAFLLGQLAFIVQGMAIHDYVLKRQEHDNEEMHRLEESVRTLDMRVRLLEATKPAEPTPEPLTP